MAAVFCEARAGNSRSKPDLSLICTPFAAGILICSQCDDFSVYDPVIASEGAFLPLQSIFAFRGITITKYAVLS